jgi:formamidopyrimidine-DNA glycosylase
MPELPEVEVTRRGLLTQVVGRTVVHIVAGKQRLRSEIPRRLLREHVSGQQIKTIDRRAKYLLVRLSSGTVLVVHLGMTGKLGLILRSVPPHKHDHLLLQLDNGRDIRFNDSRRFGAIVVWPAEHAAIQEAAFSSREGIEPLGEAFTAAHLRTLAQNRRIPIKSFLMNSRLVAGIGNIYANEILFAARIHPLTPVHRLHLQQWQRITRESRRILLSAIDAGGSTISDFLGASGHPGYFQHQFQVYGRKAQSCVRCDQSIVKTTLAGRATYHCPACQQAEDSTEIA